MDKNKEAILAITQFINQYVALSWDFGYSADVEKTNKMKDKLNQLNIKIKELENEI